jgi:N-acetylglucosamine-6-phosphate deacetylase
MSYSLAICNVRIFDGNQLLPKGIVIVQDGTITSVGGDSIIPAALISSTAMHKPSYQG